MSPPIRQRTRRLLRDTLTAATNLVRGDRPTGAGLGTLRDPAADHLLRTRGYVVVDLLSEQVAAELAVAARELHPDPPAGWSADFYSPSSRVKRAANDRIRGSLVEPLQRIFVDHRSVLHSFVLNSPGPGGGLELHQHSSIVDEDRFRSVVVWCAITPATEQNGTLHVVPRSHLLQVGPRPERSASWAEPHETVLLRDHLDSVPLSIGQAIVFDNQLLHCSFSNSTDEPRVSAVAVVVPNAADLLYFEQSDVDQDTLRVYRLDPEFFITHTAGNLEWARPDGLTLVDERAWVPTEVAEDRLADRLPAGNCGHTREPS